MIYLSNNNGKLEKGRTPFKKRNLSSKPLTLKIECSQCVFIDPADLENKFKVIKI